LNLGLQPRYLEESLVESVIQRVVQFKDRIVPDAIVPRIRWQTGDNVAKVKLVEIHHNQDVKVKS
jgi:hypothetical protein